VRRSKHYRRRGSLYVAVLGCAMAVTVIGVAALTALRVERRFAEGTADFAQARLHALSAVEMGLHTIANDPDWRTNNPNGVWETDRPIGSGTYTLEGVDFDDGDLTDFDTEPVVLTGTGWQGDARYKLQVTVVAKLDPLEVLSTCLHAAGEVHVKGGDSITVTDAPLSTNGNLRNDEIVYGDVHAATQSGGGTVTGVATIPAPQKDLPDPTVFDMYKSIATVTPIAPPDLNENVIGPGYTPWGVTNPDGVYYIDMAGHDLHIEKSRILGTLVIDCPGHKLELRDPVFIQPYRSDYPALIVNGDVEFKYKSDETVLSESDSEVNYNLPGVPYESVTDDDQLDTYPNDVRGLVHVFGTIDFMESARVRGVVIGESTGTDAVVCDKDNEIVHDPNLYANPPIGYTKPPSMVISQGTWRQVVD